MHSRSLQRRTGITLVEVLLVIGITGILLAFALPPAAAAVRAADVRSARQKIAASIVRARSAAIQHGRRAEFIRAGNIISVTVQAGNVQERVGAPINLNDTHGVNLVASRDTIAFDPRGFAIGLGSLQTFVVTKGVLSDSVCVTRMGQVTLRGCGVV